MAGWVKSPTAASEHSSSLNLGLAEWPLLGNRYFGFGLKRDQKPAPKSDTMCQVGFEFLHLTGLLWVPITLTYH